MFNESQTRARVRSLIAAEGLEVAIKHLGLHQETVLRLGADAPVHRGSLVAAAAILGLMSPTASVNAQAPQVEGAQS